MTWLFLIFHTPFLGERSLINRRLLDLLFKGPFLADLHGVRPQHLRASWFGVGPLFSRGFKGRPKGKPNPLWVPEKETVLSKYAGDQRTLTPTTKRLINPLRGKIKLVLADQHPRPAARRQQAPGWCLESIDLLICSMACTEKSKTGSGSFAHP